MSKEIDCKRFSLGYRVIEADCPKCHRPTENEYLSYPVMNEWFTETFYCGDCDEEFEKKMFLKVKLKIK